MLGGDKMLEEVRWWGRIDHGCVSGDRKKVLGNIQRLDWDAASLKGKEHGSGQEQVRCEGEETPEFALVQGDKSGA